MRTVGQILKETRESKYLTLEDVEKQTKIRVELLEALEKGNFDKLPPAIFVQGFIKNYGKFLNLNTDKLLAIFRRDYESAKHPPQILESFTKPITNKKFRLNPSQVLGAFIAILIIAFFSYLWIEYRQYVGAPTLQIISPQDQQSLETPSVTISGKTDPEATLTVEGQKIEVNEKGEFQTEYRLGGSSDTIDITATNKFGKTSTIQRTVFVGR